MHAFTTYRYFEKTFRYLLQRFEGAGQSFSNCALTFWRCLRRFTALLRIGKLSIFTGVSPNVVFTPCHALWTALNRCISNGHESRVSDEMRNVARMKKAFLWFRLLNLEIKSCPAWAWAKERRDTHNHSPSFNLRITKRRHHFFGKQSPSGAYVWSLMWFNGQE